MFKYLIKAISNAIGFTKTEAKGSLVLIFIIICSLFLYQARVNYLKAQPVTLPDSTDLAWLAEVEASISLKKEKKKTKSEYSEKKSERSTPQKNYTENKYAVEAEGEEIITKKLYTDLNTATAEQLQRIRGIGPAFSERIIKYRNLLGGFADTSQLKEVYGLKPEVISSLSSEFKLETPVQEIQLNTDSINQLAKHPYISYDLARVIINYRKQHGDFESADDLKQIKIIDEETFSRLKPYLK